MVLFTYVTWLDIFDSCNKCCLNTLFISPTVYIINFPSYFYYVIRITSDVNFISQIVSLIHHLLTTCDNDVNYSTI